MLYARLKRIVRPALFLTRQALRRIDGWIRPPRDWDGAHHPVLRHFKPWRGEACGRFVYDFLGVKTDPRFRPQLKAQPAGPLALDYPRPYAPYFELVFVLEAVIAAAHAERFCVVELGAGYGPWLVAAWKAMQATARRPVRLIGVEMVEQHHRWMHEHFRNNGIDPAAHTLILAATSDREGHGVYLPESDLEWDFGQRLLARQAGAAGDSAVAGDGGTVRVPCITLPSLLEDEARIDLLHVDIQGEELRVLRHAQETLDRKVRRLITATHSRGIHRELRAMLVHSGWEPAFDFGFRKRERSSYGDVQFLDGLLAFVNPRL